MILHAWYSDEQFKIIAKYKHRKPYLYYKDIHNKIIQVTNITKGKDHKTQFNDIRYLGEVKIFYKVSSEPLLFKNYFNHLN